MQTNYLKKYLKYKNKYLQLKGAGNGTKKIKPNQEPSQEPNQELNQKPNQNLNKLFQEFDQKFDQKFDQEFDQDLNQELKQEFNEENSRMLENNKALEISETSENSKNSLENNNLFILFITSKLYQLKSKSQLSSFKENTINNLNISTPNLENKYKETKKLSAKRTLSEITQQNQVLNNLPNTKTTLTSTPTNIFTTPINTYKTSSGREVKKSNKYSDYILQLTPALKSYAERKNENINQFINDLDVDLMRINEEANRIDKIDTDYIQYENYGKTIECWVADKMVCPCCFEPTLRRYVSDNFPVIDLMCVNPEHTPNNGVIFFQVKASGGAKFKDIPYFSKEEQIIHVGSRALGNIVHSIKTTDSQDNKKILIGYICVLFSSEENSEYLYINKSKSFIVLPIINYNEPNKKLYFSAFNDDDVELNDKMDTLNIDESAKQNQEEQLIQTRLTTNTANTANTANTDEIFYYPYVEYKHSTHPIIRWNEKVNKIEQIDNFLESNKVNKNYANTISLWEEIPNPQNIFIN